MAKIKPLLPTLRERKRYLAFDVQSASPVRDLSSVLMRALASLLGEWGMARAGIIFVHDCSRGSRGIFRVSAKYVSEVIASCTLIDRLQGVPVVIRSLGVSGMLKKARYSMEGP